MHSVSGHEEDRCSAANERIGGSGGGGGVLLGGGRACYCVPLSVCNRTGPNGDVIEQSCQFCDCRRPSRTKSLTAIYPLVT